MRRSDVGLTEIVVAWAFFLIIAAIVVMVWERATCEHGENVPVGDGSMDCYGSETFNHCEPSTRFVCHDEEKQ